MKERLCNIQYQTRRCRNAITQYVRNKAKGEFASFKCEIYHIDIGKSCFKTFQPRWDIKYAVLLIQRQISPCAYYETYRNGGKGLLILNLGNKWKRIISFMTLPLYLWAKPLGTHRKKGLVGPPLMGMFGEQNNLLSLPESNLANSAGTA